MKNKWWKKIFMILIVIILFTCIGLTNKKPRRVTMIETVLSEIITLPQRGYLYLKNWVMKEPQFFGDIEVLKVENEELKMRNKELSEKLMDYEVLLAENNVLKEHAKTVESYPDYKVIAAEVISDSVSNWEAVYLINRGSEDGIEPNMAVITTSGLVGYVETVTKDTAKVVSILDAGNSVSARLTKTRDALICKGNTLLKEKGQLKATSIPIGIELAEGDKIETSGMGGIYPKGIAIGVVKTFSLKKNPAENEAIVEPYVDFNRLETVAVIIEEKN